MTKIIRERPRVNRDFGDLMPSYRGMDGWYRSDYATLDTPDYTGNTLTTSSKIIGWEDGELTDFIAYGTGTYAINSEGNGLDVVSGGILTSLSANSGVFRIVFNNLGFGLCVETGRIFEIIEGGALASNTDSLGLIQENGAVKIGDIYVVNDSTGSEIVEV